LSEEWAIAWRLLGSAEEPLSLDAQKVPSLDAWVAVLVLGPDTE
jgi:hypothetical protein